MIPGLEAYSLVLASSSPRRQELLTALKIPFEVRVIPIKEEFPKGLIKQEITDHLAVLKATPFKSTILPQEIIITADTIVWFEDQVLGKPKDKNDAIITLRNLSDKWHEVYTSICFTTPTEQHVVHAKTEVKMAFLSPDEIRFYVEHGNPLDKAGAYGIQEWIGLAGIEELRGSYTNVVGLPTQILYKTLRAMV
ncbi:MAG: Maf family nucleotide pyrophosphatase [Flavobacteriaceae bacterium]|nr:Maf family nucleotide pyrophosphatase [Flavobacteriaceae bacterium]